MVLQPASGVIVPLLLGGAQGRVYSRLHSHVYFGSIGDSEPSMTLA